MNDGWLNKLKVGDEVAIASGGWTTYYRFALVERLTDTQIIVAGRRFNRRTGLEAGRGYNGDSLEEATPTLKAEVENRRRRLEALRVVEDTRWRDLNDETLFAVAELLKKKDEPAPARPQ